MIEGSTVNYPTGDIKAGTKFETVSYRCFINPNNVPSATVFTWYYLDRSIYVLMDFHVNLENITISVPDEFVGKKFQIIEKNSGISINNVGIIPSDGLNISVVGGYGSVIIKLIL